MSDTDNIFFSQESFKMYCQDIFGDRLHDAMIVQMLEIFHVKVKLRLYGEEAANFMHNVYKALQDKVPELYVDDESVYLPGDEGAVGKFRDITIRSRKKGLELFGAKLNAGNLELAFPYSKEHKISGYEKSKGKAGLELVEQQAANQIGQRLLNLFSNNFDAIMAFVKSEENKSAVELAELLATEQLRKNKKVESNIDKMSDIMGKCLNIQDIKYVAAYAERAQHFYSLHTDMDIPDLKYGKALLGNLQRAIIGSDFSESSIFFKHSETRDRKPNAADKQFGILPVPTKYKITEIMFNEKIVDKIIEEVGQQKFKVLFDRAVTDTKLQLNIKEIV